MTPAEIKLLVAETKVSLLEYLPNLIGACTSLVQAMQSNEDNWFDLLGRMIAGIQVVQEAITDMKKLVPSEFSDINLEELNEQLKDCAQALENQDYVSLSDLIGFAVQTTLQGYFSVLQKGVLQ
jgi:hypothetical protein